MDDFISRLPDDIKFTIYKEHFEPEYFNQIINLALSTNSSKSLNNKDLRPLIPIIFSKKYVVAFLNSNNPVFKILCNSHKLNNVKSFVLMNNGDSFSLEWLFYLYH